MTNDPLLGFQADIENPGGCDTERIGVISDSEVSGRVEYRRERKLFDAIETARQMALCAFIVENGGDLRCDGVMQGIASVLTERGVPKDRKNLLNIMSKRSNGSLERDRERALFERYQWDYANDNLQRGLGVYVERDRKRKELEILVRDLCDKDIYERVRESIHETSRRLAVDMAVSVVGANAAIAATLALLAVVGGERAALTYAAIEGALTAVPIIPGVPGLVRAGYFGVYRGIEDGIRRYRRLRRQNRATSLLHEVRRSVLLGLPTAVDYGYLIVPIVAALRNTDVDVTAASLVSTLKKGVPLQRLLKKYGKLGLLEGVY